MNEIGKNQQHKGNEEQEDHDEEQEGEWEAKGWSKVQRM